MPELRPYIKVTRGPLTFELHGGSGDNIAELIKQLDNKNMIWFKFLMEEIATRLSNAEEKIK